MMSKIERDDMMKVDGWVLRRLRGFGGDPENGSNCWAEHKCLAKERVACGTGKATYGWYPRDNAYFGACCYCGAGCPEEIMGVFLMLNANLLHKWNPNPWGRRGSKEVLDHGGELQEVLVWGAEVQARVAHQLRTNSWLTGILVPFHEG